jgi:hypothetical protein
MPILTNYPSLHCTAVEIQQSNTPASHLQYIWKDLLVGDDSHMTTSTFEQVQQMHETGARVHIERLANTQCFDPEQ